jgi:quinol monooxygenase YgiN
MFTINDSNMKSIFLSIAVILICNAMLYSQIKSNKKMEVNTKNTIVRISIGYFQPEQADKVEAMLNNEFKNSLIPAIKKLKGNLGYYVAIDKEKNAMTNVSIWRTKDDALQMATLKEMLDSRTTFDSLGVRFIEITNHQVLWKLPE